MNKKLKLLTVCTLITLMISSTGCSILFKKPPETEPEPKKIETPDTNPEEDKKAQEFVEVYFGALFSESVESYTKNLLEGEIPKSIYDHIAQRTINEGNKNPEIGIHLPRMVEINGLTILDYEILKDAEGKPVIESAFIGKNNETFLYFVKVGLKAKGLPNHLFNEYYELNEETNIYEKIEEEESGNQADEEAENQLLEEDYDYIKVTAKYDVEVIKEDNNYKVVTQKETDYKSPLRNRIVKLNNEFMEKLPYLDMNNADEKQIYENEKALLEQFFKNLLTLDKERMSLLRSTWYKGYMDFMDLMTKLEINKVNGSEILFSDASYTEKFNISSFPIQVNMEYVKEFKVLKVVQHPGYTKNNKMYFVWFEAPVVKANGMVGSETMYKYDYTVTLKVVDDNLMIDGMMLNEYYDIEAMKPKEDEKDKNKKDKDIKLK